MDWFRLIRLCFASRSDTLVAGSRKEDRRVSEAARKILDESGGLKSWMHENGLLLLMGNETIGKVPLLLMSHCLIYSSLCCLFSVE